MFWHICMQVDEPNFDGTTPLMIAASEGRDECVELLIDRGARLDAQRSSDQHSALLLACYRGHLEVVSALLEAGATHDLATYESETALEVAAANGHYEVRVHWWSLSMCVSLGLLLADCWLQQLSVVMCEDICTRKTSGSIEANYVTTSLLF